MVNLYVDPGLLGCMQIMTVIGDWEVYVWIMDGPKLSIIEA